jgi:peroxiredoxin
MSRASLPLPAMALVLITLAGSACAGPEKPAPVELAIGAPAPDFKLVGADGATHTLADYKEAKAIVVVFTCLSCPVARAYEERTIALAKDYAERGVQVVAIMPNDPSIVPADATDKLKARATEMKYPFPYLIDETQSVATTFGAKVTPHIFVFGADRKLAYRGRIDDEADPGKVTTHDLRKALDQILAGQSVTMASTKAFGCSIKWKKEKAS